MRFGWDWERWSVGDPKTASARVQNGRHVFRLFGFTIVKSPTIYLGTWMDD